MAIEDLWVKAEELQRKSGEEISAIRETIRDIRIIAVRMLEHWEKRMPIEEIPEKVQAIRNRVREEKEKSSSEESGFNHTGRKETSPAPEISVYPSRGNVSECFIKENTSLGCEQELLGFVKTEETHQEEEAKQADVMIDNYAYQLFDKMSLGKNGSVRRRKKRKSIKAKRSKYKCGKLVMRFMKKKKQRTRLEMHEGNGVKRDVYMQWLENSKLPLEERAATKKSGRGKKRKQKHTKPKKKIKREMLLKQFLHTKKKGEKAGTKCNKFKYKCTKLDREKLLQILKKNKFLAQKTWTHGETQRLKRFGHMRRMNRGQIANNMRRLLLFKKKKKSKVKRSLEVVLLSESGNRVRNMIIESLKTKIKIIMKKHLFRHKHRKKRIRKWRKGNDIDICVGIDSVDLWIIKDDSTIRDDTTSNRWLVRKHSRKKGFPRRKINRVICFCVGLQSGCNVVLVSIRNGIQLAKAWLLGIAGCLQRRCGIIPKSNWRGRQKKRRFLASNILKKGNEGKENYSGVSKTVVMVMLNLWHLNMAAKNLTNYKERNFDFCREYLTRNMLIEKTIYCCEITVKHGMVTSMGPMRGGKGHFRNWKNDEGYDAGGVRKNRAAFTGAIYSLMLQLLSAYVEEWFSELRDRSTLLLISDILREGGVSNYATKIWDPGSRYPFRMLVTEKVIVTTKHVGEQFIRESHAGGFFIVTKKVDGTKITPLLKEDQRDYVDGRRLKVVMEKQYEFISYPIYLWIENFTEIEINDDEVEDEPNREDEPKMENVLLGMGKVIMDCKSWLIMLYIWTASFHVWHRWKNRNLQSGTHGCWTERRVFQEIMMLSKRKVIRRIQRELKTNNMARATSEA